MRYAPQTHNMYAACNDDDDAMTATDGTTVILNVAAMTTGSTLTGAHTTAISESIANAINQLSANQTAMMSQISQIAAMSIAHRPPAPPSQATQAPPFQQIAILAIQPFTGAATGFQAGTTAGGGRGGRTRREGRGGRGRVGGRNVRTPFADYQQGRGRGAGRGIQQGPTGFIPQPPRPGGNNPTAPPPLNFVKMFANNNVCYLCGFDVKDGHTSVTCPTHWQKANHQEGYTRENAQGYIDAGWDACIKGKHKNLFPGF
jgi:hypothetical protein